MTEMVLTKKTFIGQGPAGRIAYPGETVDVDEKGVPVAAGSTPIGNMSDDMLEAELKRRQKASGKTAKLEPDFGDNVEESTETNTGEQRLEIASFRPGDGVNPQGVPPGTVPHGDRFIRPAPDDAPAAIEVVVGEGAEAGVVADGGAFDQDGDGKVGGSKSDEPSALAGKNKTELQAIAKAEAVAVPDNATNADIKTPIEAARKK